MIKARYVWPLVTFIVLLVLFKFGLRQDPNYVPSVLVNKTIPPFRGENLALQGRWVTENQLKGKIVLLNIWASWCQNCQIEQPILVDLARSGRLEIDGVNYKDRRSDAVAFLEKMGNPYQISLYDPEGLLSMQLGVYGAPESFLIDKKGVIRYRYAGPLTLTILEKDLMPRIKEIEKER